MWDKIWVWALTDYDRVLYLDSDIVFNRPVYPVWDDPHAWPEHGLAATADWQGIRSVPMPDGPYFNWGFMMVRPNMTMVEEIIKVDMGDHTLQWPDQVGGPANNTVWSVLMVRICSTHTFRVMVHTLGSRSTTCE